MGSRGGLSMFDERVFSGAGFNSGPGNEKRFERNVHALEEVYRFN